MFRVRRAYTKGRLKDFAKTAGSTRAVPLRPRVVTALEELPGKRRGILFPAPEGGRIGHQQLAQPLLDARPRGRGRQAPADLRPASHACDVEPGGRIDIFTLARRMGTSVNMIDRTYGHLVAGAHAYERELLDAFDNAPERLGCYLDAKAEKYGSLGIDVVGVTVNQLREVGGAGVA